MNLTLFRTLRAGLFGAALSICLAQSHAEENTYVLGIDSRCLYGLVPCWPEVREPLAKVAGLKSVSEGVDAAAWTCEVRTRDGQPPDFAAVAQTLRAGVGEQFSLRGVEANVTGTLLRRGGELMMRLGQAGAVLRLAPLTGKVQWDAHTRKEHAMSEAERAAFSVLTRRWQGKARTVRITGPLRTAESNQDQPTLEVRSFKFQ